MSEESQIKQEAPPLPEGHPVQKWSGWYPGKAGMANERGYVPGVAFKEFRREDRNGVTLSSAEVANEWFRANPGLLIVDVRYTASALLVAYSKILDPEEKAESDEVMHEARALIDKRKEERAEREAKAAEDQEKRDAEAAKQQEAEAKELKRLAELGRRHEKNCGKGKA